LWEFSQPSSPPYCNEKLVGFERRKDRKMMKRLLLVPLFCSFVIAIMGTSPAQAQDSDPNLVWKKHVQSWKEVKAVEFFLVSNQYVRDLSLTLDLGGVSTDFLLVSWFNLAQLKNKAGDLQANGENRYIRGMASITLMNIEIAETMAFVQFGKTIGNNDIEAAIKKAIRESEDRLAEFLVPHPGKSLPPVLPDDVEL
jgi:hypothetical protein